MQLGPHERKDGAGTLDTTGKVVRRQFSWPVPVGTTQEQDPRPADVTVCFYAFDGYTQSIFRCVRIMLTVDKAIYWRDLRPGLAQFDLQSTDPTKNFQMQITPTNGTVFEVAIGDTLEFRMSAKQGTGFGPIDIYISQGELPAGAEFGQYGNTVFTTDTYDDPSDRTFKWTPKVGQECRYRICFLASNQKEVKDYSMTLPAAAGTAASIDERCYEILVTDRSMSFASGLAAVESPVAPLLGDCGFSVALWFKPALTSTDMPLFTTGYTLAGSTTKEVMHQLSWVQSTPVAFTDGTTVQTGTGAAAARRGAESARGT